MNGQPDLRLGALRRFALAITVFNVLGHTWFGFEQSWAYPFAALASAYLTELLLEAIDARTTGRVPRFTGGPRRLFEFLLPTHITGMATSMLLYSGSRLGPIVFAAAAAVASKYVFRVAIAGRPRHFFNPSNFGISVALVAFPWVGIAPPYMFTENLTAAGDWILPAIIITSGSFINARFTRRMPLIAGWLGAFVAQAIVRAAIFGTPVIAGLLPMTGLAFVLFTFYMVTDPSTTPASRRGQIAFGAAVAAAYGLLMMLHVVFTLFFALSIVCAGRGLLAWAAELQTDRRRVKADSRAAAAAAPAPY